ncbi:MAG: hypothetical protein ACXVLZ_17485 [Acidimicrobiia bacterium]
MTPRARRALVTCTIATVLVGLGAPTPAGAHSTSGPPASNFSTALRGLVPPADGIAARLASDGERIELHVTGPRTVTVFGYADEPYLRVGRTGVFENRSSPAVVLNRSRVPTGPAPTGPIRPPRWVRISTAPTAVWHDHRTHWMGGATPGVVRRDPHHVHVVGHWEIPLRADTRSLAIAGTIRWTPPPSAAWWWLLAVALAAVLLVATRRAARVVSLATLALLGVGEAIHLWGSWPFSTASTGGRVGENLPSIAAVAIAFVALWWLARRTLWSAAPLLIVAGLFAFVAGGLADVSAFSHSWIPSRLDSTLARILVVVALGGGAAVAIVGAFRLRAPRTES